MLAEALALLRREGGTRMRTAIAGDQRLPRVDLATWEDPGLFGPDSVAWRVHSESSMLIGGLRALLLQTLHPLAMAGVADHSDYRHDPWGRLHRTGQFIGATTFGTAAVAERTIARVVAVHGRVQGRAPDGRPYSASDPHLLAWVHVTEVDSFLAAYERYGTGRLTNAERDCYVSEMAEIGRRLGADPLPATRAELIDIRDAYRPELSFDRQAREAVRFLLAPPVPLVLRGPYGLIGAAAIGSLPSWARWQLRLPLPPGLDPLAIRPAATALTRGVSWLMTAPARADHDDRLLSAS